MHLAPTPVGDRLLSALSRCHKFTKSMLKTFYLHRPLALIACFLLLPTPVLAKNSTLELNLNSNHQQLIAHDAPLLEELKEIAVQITVKIDSNNNGGSGVIIGKKQQSYLVITNAHVTFGDNNFSIQTHDGVVHQAQLVPNTKFSNRDMALLQFRSSKQYEPADINPSNLRQGIPVLAAGYPGETNKIVYHQGKITQLPEQSFKGGYQIGYSSDIVQGMSGGAILDAEGGLIGINGRSAYPILNSGYVYEDGSRPLPEAIKQFRRSSWGIPIQTFLAEVNSETLTAYSLPFPVQKSTITQPSLKGWLGELEQKTKQFIVRIDSSSNTKDSGVIIAKTGETYTVLTTAHVLCERNSVKESCGNYRYEIVTPDGKAYAIIPDSIKIQPGVDLAIAQFSSKTTYQVATLANASVTDDQYVFVGGYSSLANRSKWQFNPGKTYSLEQGLLQLKDNFFPRQGYELVYTNITYAGMAGAPVLDTQGRVIGIHGAVEGEIAIDEKTGDSGHIQMGYSLGIPINTFISLANHFNLNSQSLQVQSSSFPQLNTAQKDAIEKALLSISVPKSNAKPSVWIERGNQLWRLGQYDQDDQAIAAFEQAIKQKPAYVHLAWYGKGMALASQDKYTEAVAAFEQAIKNKQNFYPALKEQSIALQQLNQLERALVAIDQAILIQPENANLYLKKSLVLKGLKRYPGSLAAITKAVQISPNAEVYNQRGNIYPLQKQWDLAIADFNKAIEINPINADAYINRGFVYYNLKKWDLALADFNQAIQLNPQYVEAFFNIGLVNYEMGKTQEAIQRWQQVVNLDKKQAEPQMALAVAMYSKGESETAFEMAEVALCLDKRLADIAYFQEQLWGDRMIADTQKFFATPKMQAYLSQMQGLSSTGNK
ncbi:Tetratricopeptide TPR_1 repeat-containing protein [Crinalium epipsammum PCC 9333]|uniref:Tetratricopeptide TPR_1 repeat-containing protein n=1 Tax=Crinalium epipsammum PCC 9333 TaxID=1173022 RepID=K9VVB8_9CYAN|nr:trypsin-like peptidase domain-containing protein [Crinalium epipsammum]AFZ11447.1 Tetratricopeptide TPR_1 repeat-containing protein [Crinalium epipsammum PCC 9333]